ncbi:MAG: hypothetical protein N3J91_02125 [Verrucomicrobiae bacterium]|nr:hypothetical protein [Verrucomicrobiae bacterium]
MRSRFWLGLSLALNLLLLGLWWQAGHRPPPAPPPVVVTATEARPVIVPARVVTTNIFIQTNTFHWRQVESDDYFQYVANLRAIGCPEATIRDIIVADVNQHYARKRAALITTEHDQWWRLEPDLEVLSRAASALELLERERRQLLRALLGADWEAQERAATPGNKPAGPRFTGPVLSQLPAATISAIYDAWETLQRRLAEHVRQQAAEGRPPDPLVSAHLQREYRERLEHLLTAEQLEEFLLRNSPLADRARVILQGFDASPEEFRGIFRILDRAERQLMWATVTSPEAYEAQRQQLQKQAEAELQRQLGRERFQEYKLNQDPVFRETRLLAEELGVPPEATLPLYEIQKASAEEELAIRNNPALTPDARTAALQTLREQREAALRVLLGDQLYESYSKSREPRRP